MSRTPCHFYNKPGGCRSGNRCRYSHDVQSKAHSDGSVSSPSGNSPASNRIVVTKAPNGICNSYWSTGACNKEFNCRFKHTRPTTESDNSRHSNNSPSGSRAVAIESIAHFLTDAGLAKISGSGTDAFSTSLTKPITPSETHEHLRYFLNDDYRFNTTTQMYRFLALLTNASSINDKWSSEDGQLLLHALASGNGLLRLGDIIRYHDVSTRAGTNNRTLSFQQGYIPLLTYLSSDFVVKSTLNHLVNALYAIVENNYDRFVDVVEKCMDEAMASKSFKDPGSRTSTQLMGSKVMASLIGVLFEYLTRFKHATAMHPSLPSFVRKVNEWLNNWIEAIRASPPTFDDVLTVSPAPARDHIIQNLRSRAERVVNIVDREQAIVDRSANRLRNALKSLVTSSNDMQGVLAALANTYEGPGDFREEGPRHDNDFVEIGQIQIAPTDEELSCRIPPFLPANIPNAPHTFPSDSMERLLDIQFRLLREELTAPLRTSVQLVLDDLMSTSPSKTQLHAVKNKRGGRYRHQGLTDSVIFSVYTNVQFGSLKCDYRRGIVVDMRMDTPPGSARASTGNARANFWKLQSGKRLMQGGLVALIWTQGPRTSVCLGVVASSAEDVANSARRSAETLSLRVQFFEPLVELRILEALRSSNRPQGMFLLEAPVMFEAIRPFLESLKREPESLPFKRYLVHNDSLSTSGISPPNYSLVPNFTFQLKSLFDDDEGVDDLRLSVRDPASIELAREQLRNGNRLDPSQADAVLEALTREVSLIQGPPGTGKSYTGVELIRVLLANNTGPILMIAFTNHALDHMLCSVLDAKITNKIARLGSRSSDPKISQFSVEELEKVATRSRLDRAMAKEHRSMKETESEMEKLMDRFLDQDIPADARDRHLGIRYPDHFQELSEPPQWVQLLHKLSLPDEHNDSWMEVGSKGKAVAVDNSLYGFWKAGGDLNFLQQPRESARTGNRPDDSPVHGPEADLLPEDPLESESEFSDSDETESSFDEDLDIETRWQLIEPPDDQDSVGIPKVALQRPELRDALQQDLPSSSLSTAEPPTSSYPPAQTAALHLSDLSNVEEFFRHFGLPSVPPPSTFDRHLESLIQDYDVWDMSSTERRRLDEHWAGEIREWLYESQKADFQNLRNRHELYRERQHDKQNEVRLQVLRNVDIIGCTTTGAAKLTSLLKGLSPRIMLVEEAGQVLEAHVLGSLVESVQHLILIGDPLQLRPTLNNFELSTDHPRGGKIYRFDMSLMERLSKSGLSMSRLDVQRRMRPSISALIRNTLYPSLEDHDLVKNYQHVRGFEKNLFFLTHSHKEQGGGEDSVSKHNTFEVAMIKDLVLYLLRQGCYSEEGNIVVLCAYLGQLARVRDALASEVAVVIDERDQVELAEHEQGEIDIQGATIIEKIKVTQRVKIRSVDNYQGEEADIVILSLVRNSGGAEEDGPGHDSGTRFRPNIGFLKSQNRMNVALSRAKQGLYILGNAADLAAKSYMWASIIEQLEAGDAVGDAIPIKCHRHPDEVQYISEPGMLQTFSPDGGCLKPCDSKLDCGHMCPYKCHSDDENHLAVRCSQPCQRLCPQGHPCQKQCADDCGRCSHSLRDVGLPCGHTVSTLPCWRMEDLSLVDCHAIVTRVLPNCEHAAQMACGDDINTHMCQAVCGGTMSCCSRPCKSKCGDCTRINMAEALRQPQGPEGALRICHKEHLCKRPLYCEHQCKGICSPEHSCSEGCKEACRQVCPHAQCKFPCSKPCAPCLSPCTWKCPHFICPVPCGSVCARLPCDKPCTNELLCGHACPSVCGEDCTLQKCPVCSSEEDREQIVDFIMQRTLKEISPDEGTLDEMLITLPICGHTFTVETLDGHCVLTGYYRQDEEGEWSGLAVPSSGFKKPPTCPNCRSAITSPRYGRVFKRADLDILETNVAADMGRSLSNAHSLLSVVDKAGIEERIRTDVAGLLPPKSDSKPGKNLKRTKARAAVLKEKRNAPLNWAMLEPSAGDLHGVSFVEAARWRGQTMSLQRIYQQAYTVATTRSAHKKAWESAFANLYRQEMDSIIADPVHAPRAPEEHAMRMAKIHIGQPKPLADTRFCVEAFWLTLSIRFTVSDLAQTWLSTATTNQKYPSTNRRVWANFISFVLNTCLQDSKSALNIAEESDSHRQISHTQVLLMRAKLELFKFNVQMSRDNGMNTDERMALAEKAQENMEEAKLTAKDAQRNGHTTSDPDPVWFKTNFTIPTEAIIGEWRALQVSLRGDTFYAPVSLDELTQIDSALGFSHTGHYYRCPNGHLFVIGECGGAMEMARCPECGANIGGSGHNLVSGNSRATEMEEIARRRGAHQSPWAWAR